MEPIGVLARWHVAFVIIHVMLTIMSIHLMNHLLLVKDRFLVSVYAIEYLLLGIIPLHSLRLGFIADQEWAFARYIHISGVVSAVRLALVWDFQMKLWEDQSLAWNDNCEGCYSVLRVCFGVMVLLNILETIVACLIYDDPSRSGDMVLMVGNTRVRVGVALGRFGGVLIRCGRVLGGFDGLVAWRLRLGSMSSMFLTLVLGGFGSVMTAHVFWTCLVLAFLETILVCASRQKMFDVFVRFRYIIVSVVKSFLVGYLVLDVYLHPFTESSGCTEGSACYSRLRECFWVMLVFYSLEVFLALLLFVYDPKREANIWAAVYGGILSMSSALSMTQVAIVGLLLGGSYGPLMTARGFWVCAITAIVEMAALMGITDWMGKAIKTRMDTGLSLLITTSAFIMVPAVRIGGPLILSSVLTAGYRDNTLMIADMSNCNETCKARGRDLINFCEWAGVVQFILSAISLMSITSAPRARPPEVVLCRGSLEISVSRGQ